MFVNIFFLFIVLLLISISSEIKTESAMSVLSVFSLYLLSLGIIVSETVLIGRKLYYAKDFLLKVVNIKLIIFLFIYFFIFSPESNHLFNAVMALSFYFFGLCTYHFTVYHILKLRYLNSLEYVGNHLRLLLPFVIPFLIFSLFMDVKSYTSQNVDYYFLIFLGLVGPLLFLFIPYLIQIIWKCHDLKNDALRKQLESFCKKAHFKHAGMRTWSILNHSLTAGIVGILPQFRYVMFSEKLLEELPPEQIEAILAHEIGHSQRYHLVFYPFIISGMVFLAGFLTVLLSDFFTQLKEELPWEIFYVLAIFLFYLLIFALYFRFVFGFYSRLLEREADLHIFDLNVPPENLINAFTTVGASTGTYELPSWHHFSIKERVDFIKKAIKHPKVVEKHHKKVKIMIFIYFLIFITLTVFLFSP